MEKTTYTSQSTEYVSKPVTCASYYDDKKGVEHVDHCAGYSKGECSTTTKLHDY